MSVDPELRRLLIEELERHLPHLVAKPLDRAIAVRSMHALKGSAALAGERDLAGALERVHRRMREGEDRAFAEAAELVQSATRRMRAGEPAIAARWPEPPEDLDARPLEPLVRAQYAAEATDRLARIDDALASSADPVESVGVIYRQVHTLKGAASAVGDDPMSWFCHGLEEHLKGASTHEEAQKLLKEVARWRGLLGALLEEPESALRTLRGEPSRAPPAAPSAPRRTSNVPSSRAPDEESPRSFGEEAATIRVAAQSVDRLIDELESIDLTREKILVSADRAREIGRYLRTFRGGLIEALRLIGPPRPWGAPAAALRRIEDAVAALGVIVEEMDGTSASLREGDHALKDSIADAKRQLSSMRQMPVGRIFARMTTAIESESRRAEKAVIVRTRGAEETIDRRVAEALVEPCLQLVRNAVAHGIESNAVRVAQHKPPAGTISLSAKRVGSRLRITIEDDGAGVNVARLRARAIDAGIVSRELADAADDDTLLTLLFVPGFSTRESSDLLAGRGIGLDIARSAVQRLGGAIRLSSRPKEGFSARVEVPIESGLATVLWAHAGGEEYAIPTANVVRVRTNAPGDPLRVPHLVTCLEARAHERSPYVVELDLQGDDRDPDPVGVGVDGVGRTEQVLVRPLSPLVAGLGPFAGAVLRGDGGLRLAIDAYAIAPRARALSRVDSRPSSIPPSSSPASRRVY